MPLPNLFALALKNAERLGTTFEKRCGKAQTPAGLLRTFSRSIEDHARVSINMTTAKMHFFLDDRRYLNPFETARKLATKTGEDSEAVLRRLQRRWYKKRIAFDRHFEDGEAFRYGALNLGGGGLGDYGKFCVVFDREATAKEWTAAYVRDNSLKRYVAGPNGGHRVDEAKIAREIAPPARRHQLAALKHDRHLAGLPPSAWPAVLCSDTGFIEAIFTGEVLLSQIEEIRIRREHTERFADLLSGLYTGTLEKGDKEEAEAYHRLTERLDVEHLLERVKEV